METVTLKLYKIQTQFADGSDNKLSFVGVPIFGNIDDILFDKIGDRIIIRTELVTDQLIVPKKNDDD